MSRLCKTCIIFNHEGGEFVNGQLMAGYCSRSGYYIPIDDLDIDTGCDYYIPWDDNYKSRRTINKRKATRRKRTIEEVYKSPTYPATTNETLLREIADVAELDSQTKRRFVQFGLLFWEGKRADPTYILEWARRFRRGSEYSVADDVRLGYLKEVDGVVGARNRLFETYIRGGSRPDIAENNVMKYYPKERRVKMRKVAKPKRINMRHSTKNH